MNCSTLGLPVLHCLPEFAQAHVHWVCDAIPPSHPLPASSPFALSFAASGCFPVSQFFASGGQNIGASASAPVLPMNIQGLISFRIDLFDLLAVQGTFKSLLHHHSSKAKILQHSAFFMAQLTHPYMITGKTTTLTIQTFVSKMISQLFNTLSRFAIAFLPKNKHLLTSCLQSLS